ncbi:MAG TPA: hypothetical protein VEW69_04150 [Alphaproteobacteria bacterium]|nr:hypothetical protein [Alphaproteobacteria bacterium]
MKKSSLTAALFLLTASLASAGAQSMTPASGDSSNPTASSSDKTNQPEQNDQQEGKKDKKHKKDSKVKTKKPASDDKKNEPMYGIYG